MRFTWSLACHSTLGSTSDFCKQQAENGAASGLAVLAYRQTAGRGTRGRSWAVSEGNLSFSFLCRHERIDDLVEVLPFMVAIAAHDALSGFVPMCDLRIKWPNDLVFDGAKLCGVLIERGGVEEAPWVVIGIGANLREAPLLTDRRTTCLFALGAKVAPEQAAESILAQFAKWLSRWEREGFAPLREAWLDRAHELGSRLAVDRGGDYIDGFFAGLDARGSLLLQTDPDTVVRISTGDVLLLG